MRRLLDDSLLAIETGKPDHHEELIAIADLLEREVSDRRLAGASVTLAFEGRARTAKLLGDPGRSAASSPISPTTPSPMAARQRSSRRRMANASSSPSTIGAAASTRRFARRCSSPSCGLKNRGTATLAGPDWASQSPARWPTPRAGTSPLPTRQAAARARSSSCRSFRCPHTTKPERRRGNERH